MITKGLKFICVKDDSVYEPGRKVSDEEFAKMTIKREIIYPDWNYIVSPGK